MSWFTGQISRKLTLAFCALTFGILATVATQKYAADKRNIERHAYEVLEAIGRGVAYSIDGDAHRAWVEEHGSKQGAEKGDPEAFDSLRLPLVQAHSANGLPTDIYTLVLTPELEGSIRSNSGNPVPGGTFFALTSSTEPYYGHRFEYKPEMADVFLHGRPARLSPYRSDNGTWISVYLPVRDSANQVVALLELDQPMEEIYAALVKATWGNVLIYSSAAALALLGIWLMSRAISRPLLQLAQDASRFGEGDCSNPITTRSKDEVGLVSRALEGARDKIHDLIANVRRDVNGIEGRAQEVAETSAKLSSSSNSQAASLQEIRNSLEELTKMTQNNAQSAGGARDLARDSRQSAEQSMSILEQLQGAMHQIVHSSEQVSGVLSTIDEIAFQTNLLALNAAVEAARAGEAGLGFAVVAEEIRGLAIRCGEAAQSTSRLISESVQNAQEGKDVANQVGQSFGAIANKAESLDSLVDEIAGESEQQSRAIVQVSDGLQVLDDALQVSVSGSNWLAEASEDVFGQIQRIDGELNFFRLQDAGSNPPRSITESV